MLMLVVLVLVVAVTCSDVRDVDDGGDDATMVMVTVAMGGLVAMAIGGGGVIWLDTSTGTLLSLVSTWRKEGREEGR
jgi:hypothetical protein